MEYQSLDLKPLPSRPQRVKNPDIKPLKLISNHIPITISKSQKISLYTLEIEPEVPRDARKKIRFLFNQAREQFEKDIGKALISGWCIFAIRKNIAPLSYKVMDSNNKEHVLTLLHKKEFELQLLQSEAQENIEVITQSFNVILKEMMRELKMVEIGRTKKFFYNDIQHTDYLQKYGLEFRTGFHTNTLSSQTGPRLLIDYFSRIFWMGTALDAIKDFQGTEKEIKDYYIGLSVIAEYGNHRTYQIDDIDFKSTPKNVTIMQSNGGEISLLKYYKERYEINIKDPNQPLFVAYLERRTPEGKRIEQQVFLVPELCKFTGLTDDLRNNKKVMKEVARFTKIAPQDRIEKLVVHKNSINKELEKKKWDIHIGDVPIVNGFQINTPNISVMGNLAEVKPNTGLFDIKTKVTDSFVLSKWLVIHSKNPEENPNESDVDFFVNEMKAQGKTLGITIKNPKVITLEKCVNEQDIIEPLRKVLVSDVQMTVALFNTEESKFFYKPFKRLLIEEKSLPSQVLLVKNLYTKNVSPICKKLLLQMYAKMGYGLWTVQISNLIPKKTMIIGADVYHNVKARKLSIIGFCSSIDQNFTRYYSRIKTQAKKGQEIMKNISILVKEAVSEYEKFNKHLPETIIFYRDGVGKGQFNEVRTVEISNILSGFGEIKSDYKPNFLEIIVTKRINDRFFVRSNDMIRNPPSGTLVCDEVVSKNFDFFLCAQNVTEGTCTPTHYNVVYNTTPITEDEIEKFTYHQCFNYYNWSGAIRVPACVKYADLLAYNVGHLLEKEPNLDLCKKLYYL